MLPNRLKTRSEEIADLSLTEEEYISLPNRAKAEVDKVNGQFDKLNEIKGLKGTLAATHAAFVKHAAMEMEPPLRQLSQLKQLLIYAAEELIAIDNPPKSEEVRLQAQTLMPELYDIASTHGLLLDLRNIKNPHLVISERVANFFTYRRDFPELGREEDSPSYLISESCDLSPLEEAVSIARE